VKLRAPCTLLSLLYSFLIELYLLNLLQDWPTQDMGIEPELLHCRLCGTRLCLVAQARLHY
jgi:hypothetical protein